MSNAIRQLLIIFAFLPILLIADDLKNQILSMRERAQVRDELLKDRIKTVLPAIMRRNKLDMWVIIERLFSTLEWPPSHTSPVSPPLHESSPQP